MAFPGDNLHRVVGRWRDHLTEAQWDAIRTLGIGAGVLVAAAAAYAAGRPLWAKWQNRQALAEARVFAARKDYANLVLALRRATQLEPADLATWQETARQLAEIGSPEAVAAREQAARLAPGDPNLRAALVEEALRFGRYDTAQAALAGFSAAAQREVAYHRLAVALATAQGRELDIERELAALLAVEPGNLNARFTYEARRLWNADPAGAAAARAALAQLQREPSVRIRATIELLAEAARQEDGARMVALLGRSLALFAPGAPPDFRTAQSSGWDSLLAGMQAAAAAGPPTDAALLGRWLADLGRRPAALAWLKGLPAALRGAPVVADISAELSAEEGDLPGLQSLLAQGAWGVWPDQARGLALDSRRQALRLDSARARASWDEAIRACGDSLTGLRNLGRLAIAWHDAPGAEAAWLAILDRDPGAGWAYAALRASYLARGERAALFALYTRWVAHDPHDDALAADWVCLGCLLDRVSRDLADRAAALDPDAAGATAAKAAVLWRAGDSARAAALLSALPASVRAQPRNAFWLAIARADAGPPGEAAAALAAAFRFPRTGEELALLRTAGAKVGFVPP